MPELPEVEFARTCLERWLGGRVVAHAEEDRTRVTGGMSPAAFASLAGHRVLAVERRGKWLLLRFDGDVGLLAHLGMTGKFELVTSGEAPPRWSRARLARADDGVVHYRDPRLLGRLVVAPLAKILEEDPLASLGPDAWTTPIGAVLAKRLGRSTRPVKDVLMDQTVVAGLGNIQATEALFLAGIHPARRGKSIGPAETDRLRKAIRASLGRTLKMNRGDKITYVEESKRIKNPFHIYGKAGKPCPRCGTIVRKMTISGRTTAFCLNCQPRRPPRSDASSRRR